VCAGALERDGPRPRGGGVEPSSEADPTRGGVKASSEADPPEGVCSPRARRTLLEGHSAAPPCWTAGATRGMVVSCMCFRCVC
jgi:hypothetical protein